MRRMLRVTLTDESLRTMDAEVAAAERDAVNWRKPMTDGDMETMSAVTIAQAAFERARGPEEIKRARDALTRAEFQERQPHYMPPPGDTHVRTWQRWAEANLTLFGREGEGSFEARFPHIARAIPFNLPFNPIYLTPEDVTALVFRVSVHNSNVRRVR